MRKKLSYVVGFTSLAMVLAVLGVTRYSVAMVVAFPAVTVIYALLVYVFLWRDPERSGAVLQNSAKQPQNRLALIIVPMAIGAVGALVSALQEGWNIGDTIGAGGFVLLLLLVGYQVVRRKRSA